MPERDHGMNGDIENEHRSGSREQQIAGDEFQALEEAVEAIDIFDTPPPGGSGILNDERLLHSANTTQRARLMSGLQRTHGNAHVQRVIENIHAQRTPKPNPFAQAPGGGPNLQPNPFAEEGGEGGAVMDFSNENVVGGGASGGQPNPFAQAPGGGPNLKPNPFTEEGGGGGTAPNTGMEQQGVPGNAPNPFAQAPGGGPNLQPNPFAEEGGGTGAGGIFSARSTWDTEVVGGIRLAHEALGAEPPNAELAFDILTAVRESLTSLADEYRDSDAKMAGDLRHFRTQLMSASNALRPHVNATAPIEDIREAISPEGPLESWINTLGGVIQ